MNALCWLLRVLLAELVLDHPCKALLLFLG